MSVIQVLKATWQAFSDDKAPRLSAAISYATMFSIVPLAHGRPDHDRRVGDWHRQGRRGSYRRRDRAIDHGASRRRRQRRDRSARADCEFVQQAAPERYRPGGRLADPIIIGASGLFGTLQDALSTIWHIEAIKGGWRWHAPARGSRRLRDGRRRRVSAAGLVRRARSSVASVVAAHFARLIPIPAGAALLNAVSWLISLVLASVVFGLIYTVLPDVRLRWRDVWIGALATAVLFVVGQTAIAWYLSVAGVASAYGAAGAILIAFIWVYYSSAILLLGAEFTKVRAATATTTAPAEIRNVTLQPAGVDPRREPDPAVRA